MCKSSLATSAYALSSLAYSMAASTSCTEQGLRTMCQSYATEYWYFIPNNHHQPVIITPEYIFGCPTSLKDGVCSKKGPSCHLEHYHEILKVRTKEGLPGGFEVESKDASLWHDGFQAVEGHLWKKGPWRDPLENKVNWYLLKMIQSPETASAYFLTRESGLTI